MLRGVWNEGTWWGPGVENEGPLGSILTQEVGNTREVIGKLGHYLSSNS